MVQITAGVLMFCLSPSLSLSYTARVVGNGVRAQRQNPEVRVRGADAVLMDVKNKLELFNKVRSFMIWWHYIYVLKG